LVWTTCFAAQGIAPGFVNGFRAAFRGPRARTYNASISDKHFYEVRGGAVLAGSFTPTQLPEYTVYGSVKHYSRGRAEILNSGHSGSRLKPKDQSHYGTKATCSISGQFTTLHFTNPTSGRKKRFHKSCPRQRSIFQRHPCP